MILYQKITKNLMSQAGIDLIINNYNNNDAAIWFTIAKITNTIPTYQINNNNNNSNQNSNRYNRYKISTNNNIARIIKIIIITVHVFIYVCFVCMYVCM